MTSAFILTLDTGSDTDLLGIAEEIQNILSDQFAVTDVKPWAHPTLPETLSPQNPQQNT